MIKNTSHKIIYLLFFIIFTSVPILSQESDDDAPPKSLSPGILASIGQYPTTRDVAVTSDVVSPIVGGITKSDRRCSATVSNTSSTHAYVVRFVVSGRKKDDREVLRRSYRENLGAGQAVTKELNCEEDLNLALLLMSGERVE
jgi:hypothetical protein